MASGIYFRAVLELLFFEVGDGMASEEKGGTGFGVIPHFNGRPNGIAPMTKRSDTLQQIRESYFETDGENL
jgi:hypothetical protein